MRVVDHVSRDFPRSVMVAGKDSILGSSMTRPYSYAQAVCREEDIAWVAVPVYQRNGPESNKFVKDIFGKYDPKVLEANMSRMPYRAADKTAVYHHGKAPTNIRRQKFASHKIGNHLKGVMPKKKNCSLRIDAREVSNLCIEEFTKELLHILGTTKLPSTTPSVGYDKFKINKAIRSYHQKVALRFAKAVQDAPPEVFWRIFQGSMDTSKDNVWRIINGHKVQQAMDTMDDLLSLKKVQHCFRKHLTKQRIPANKQRKRSKHYASYMKSRSVSQYPKFPPNSHVKSVPNPKKPQNCKQPKRHTAHALMAIATDIDPTQEDPRRITVETVDSNREDTEQYELVNDDIVEEMNAGFAFAHIRSPEARGNFQDPPEQLHIGVGRSPLRRHSFGGSTTTTTRSVPSTGSPHSQNISQLRANLRQAEYDFEQRWPRTNLQQESSFPTDDSDEPTLSRVESQSETPSLDTNHTAVTLQSNERQALEALRSIIGKAPSSIEESLSSDASNTESDSNTSSSSSSDSEDINDLLHELSAYGSLQRSNKSIDHSVALPLLEGALTHTAKKYKKLQKKLKKTKKKRKRSTEVIFRYLMKAIDFYAFGTLAFHPQPQRRRLGFSSFIDRMKLATSNVKELKSVLKDVSSPEKPTTQSASKALFRALCACVDKNLLPLLQEMQTRLGKEDGYEALLFLRSLLADTEDSDHQILMMNEFCSIEWDATETIYSFNKRFNRTYRDLVGSGQQLSEKKKIQTYLRALRLHKSSAILFEIKNMVRDNEAGIPQILTSLQHRLDKEENSLRHSNSRVFHDHTIARHDASQRGHNRQRSTKQANAASIKPKRECYACKKTDHILRNCPTTSEEDKAKIYKSMKRAINTHVPRKNPTLNSSQTSSAAAASRKSSQKSSHHSHKAANDNIEALQRMKRVTDQSKIKQAKSTSERKGIVCTSCCHSS